MIAISFLRLPVLIFFIFTSSLLPGKTQKNEFSEYRISLNIDNLTGNICVNGELILIRNCGDTGGISLYLDSNMVFSKFNINGLEKETKISEVSDIRFMPAARKIIIGKHEISQGLNRIEFKYYGKLKSPESIYANTISSSWTEIGLYLPWFPYLPEVKKLFNYRVSVLNIPGYEIFGLGKVIKEGDSTIITSTSPTNDIPICVSDKIQHSEYSDESTKLHIFHRPDNNEFAERLAAEVLIISNILQNKLHPKDNFEITLIESQRELGGGYARQGGIVLGGLSNDESEVTQINLKWYISHELAHLWWYNANTTSWEDWLNESFAEMSAAMVIRETEGDEVFKKVMAKKIAISKHTPPIFGFDRNGSKYEVAYKVLYNKGVCLLYELEELVGKDKFSKLFSSFSNFKVKTTEKFIEELSRSCGKDVADWFFNNLKTR